MEAEPFAPSRQVQHCIRALRFGQIAVVVSFVFLEPILDMFGRLPFEFLKDLSSNVIVHGGIFYCFHFVVRTIESNAFEVTYDGQVLYSKISTGRFPEPGELTRKLRAVGASARSARP